MDDKSKLYNQLYKAVKDCYSDKNSQAWLKKTMDLLIEAKTETNDIVELKTRVSVMIKNLKSELSCRKKAVFLSFLESQQKNEYQFLIKVKTQVGEILLILTEK